MRASGTFRKLKTGLGKEGGEHGLGLEHGESSADTAPWPGAEGHIGATVASGACLGGKPRWIEAKRIGPQTPVPVNDIDGDDDGGAGGKPTSPSLIGLLVIRIMLGAGG